MKCPKCGRSVPWVKPMECARCYVKAHDDAPVFKPGYGFTEPKVTNLAYCGPFTVTPNPLGMPPEPPWWGMPTVKWHEELVPLAKKSISVWPDDPMQISEKWDALLKSKDPNGGIEVKDDDLNAAFPDDDDKEIRAITRRFQRAFAEAAKPPSPAGGDS